MYGSDIRCRNRKTKYAAQPRLQADPSTSSGQAAAPLLVRHKEELGHQLLSMHQPYSRNNVK
jgi:hypothetical protein